MSNVKDIQCGRDKEVKLKMPLEDSRKELDYHIYILSNLVYNITFGV